jgi:hypothetical protein
MNIAVVVTLFINMQTGLAFQSNLEIMTSENLKACVAYMFPASGPHLAKLDVQCRTQDNREYRQIITGAYKL